jgi:hypothetical protein
VTSPPNPADLLAWSPERRTLELGRGVVPASILFLVAFARGGEVHVVDVFGGAGSEFTNLQAAIDSATSGDLLLVRAGTYVGGAHVTDKSLSIAAESDAQVVVNGLTIEQTSESGSVTVRGVTLRLGTEGSALVARANAGVVWIEDCRIGFANEVGLPGPVAPAILVESSTRVVLRNVEVMGTTTSGAFYTGDGGAAAIVRDSGVHAFSSRFEGAAGSSAIGGAALVGVGGDGVIVQGGIAFFAGCELLGGKGGNGIWIGGPLPCKSGKNGGDGIDLGNSAIARTLDVVMLGGAGGAPAPTGGCGGGSSGLAMRQAPGTTHLVLPGEATEFSISSPARESTTHALHASGPAGASLLLLVAITPHAQPALVAKGALLVAPPFWPIAFGALPHSGTLDVVIPAGVLPPGLDGLTAFVQPLFTDSAGSQLGPGTSVVLLDAAL